MSPKYSIGHALKKKRTLIILSKVIIIFYIFSREQTQATYFAKCIFRFIIPFLFLLNSKHIVSLADPSINT